MGINPATVRYRLQVLRLGDPVFLPRHARRICNAHARGFTPEQIAIIYRVPLDLTRRLLREAFDDADDHDH